MPMVTGRLLVATRGQGLHEITGDVTAWLGQQDATRGLLIIFIRHTSASLLIQENAAPEVRADLEDFFRALAPEDVKRYRHDDEGADDMPAHIRSALLPSHLAIPIEDGRPLLGTWQGIYIFEHRRAPHRRELVLQLWRE
jgi:secondary thiamine-phosphate synthase enzyme